MSIVTDLTIARLPTGRRCNFLIIKSDFTPFTIATSVPFLPCPSLLVTIVYSSVKTRLWQDVHRDCRHKA